MLISDAFAQGMDMAAGAPAAPNPLWNFGLLAVMVVLFYILLIRPQQKRFKEHSQVLADLVKGDIIVTAGGVVGQIENLISDEELLVKLSADQSVTVRRATVSAKLEKDATSFKLSGSASKSAAKAAEKKSPAKKAAAKKAPAKKTAAKKSDDKKSA